MTGEGKCANREHIYFYYCEHAVYFQQNDGLKRLKGDWFMAQTPTDIANHLNKVFSLLSIQKEKKIMYFPASLQLHLK